MQEGFRLRLRSRDWSGLNIFIFMNSVWIEVGSMRAIVGLRLSMLLMASIFVVSIFSWAFAAPDTNSRPVAWDTGGGRRPTLTTSAPKKPAPKKAPVKRALEKPPAKKPTPMTPAPH